MGAHLLLVQPIEKVVYYHFLLERGLTSNRLGVLTETVGILNLLRFFRNGKINEIAGNALQCGLLMIFLLMLFSIVNNDVIPIAAVFYGMTAILSFILILRREV